LQGRPFTIRAVDAAPRVSRKRLAATIAEVHVMVAWLARGDHGIAIGAGELALDEGAARFADLYGASPLGAGRLGEERLAMAVLDGLSGGMATGGSLARLAAAVGVNEPGPYSMWALAGPQRAAPRDRRRLLNLVALARHVYPPPPQRARDPRAWQAEMLRRLDNLRLLVDAWLVGLAVPEGAGMPELAGIDDLRQLARDVRRLRDDQPEEVQAEVPPDELAWLADQAGKLASEQTPVRRETLAGRGRPAASSATGSQAYLAEPFGPPDRES
jgi:hypothetical protein